MPEAGVDLVHVSDSESEVDTGLPSSTASPRLEDLSNMKRTTVDDRLVRPKIQNS
jgi:hypothetical protein